MQYVQQTGSLADNLANPFRVGSRSGNTPSTNPEAKPKALMVIRKNASAVATSCPFRLTSTTMKHLSDPEAKTKALNHHKKTPLLLQHHVFVSPPHRFPHHNENSKENRGNKHLKQCVPKARSKQNQTPFSEPSYNDHHAEEKTGYASIRAK